MCDGMAHGLRDLRELSIASNGISGDAISQLLPACLNSRHPPDAATFEEFALEVFLPSLSSILM